MTSSTDLAQRYGAPSPVRKKLVLSLVMLLTVLSAWWVSSTMLFHANPQVSSRLIGFDIVDEHTVEVEVQVQLDEIDEAQCLVRALSRDKSVVGELEFGGIDGQQEVTVRTEREATSIERGAGALRCLLAG